MDGISAAATALGALALLSVAARWAAALARAGALAAARARRTATGAARTLGARGLLAAAAAAATSAATAASSTAAPAPVSGSPVPAPVHRAHVATPTTHVVRPGDSLWAIAAQHLGPGASDAAIAAAWPRWYDANRAVIGSNPSLLLVGTLLRVPHGRRTGTSASPHRPSAHPGTDRSASALDPDRR